MFTGTLKKIIHTTVIRIIVLYKQNLDNGPWSL
jgi:hypothetical protein